MNTNYCYLRRNFIIRSISLFNILFLLNACNSDNKNYNSWLIYGGSPENIKYSSLSQIDTNNVTGLKPVWEYHSGDADTANHSQIQCNPIIIDSIVYGTTPQMKLFALHAGTGKVLWIFNPFDSLNSDKTSFFIMNNCRGLAYWTDKKNDRRIFYTAGSFLYCIDALNGLPVNSFGDSGKIDLHKGLGRNVDDLFVTATSPGIIFKQLIIMGSRVDEGAAAAPGHIRAFNVLNGKQEWIFHTIPHPGEAGYETWDDTAAYKHIGGANCWSGFSLDEKRGVVYAPTGSASFDFYGGKRTGNNLFADCLLALDATTGKLKWYFQDIHHDVWDKDLPAPPALITVTKDYKKIDAIAQITKTGFVFVLDRETGKPIYLVTEINVPVNTDLSGEKLSPTQPVPLFPAPFVRQVFTENDINNLLPDSSFKAIKEKYLSINKGTDIAGIFTPPSLKGTLIFPGYDGGGEWGGPAYDPATNMLYVNANEMPWILQMVDIKNIKPQTETFQIAGERLYKANCMNCHGPDRKGTGNNPSLTEMFKKYNEQQFTELLTSGRRMMPAFKQLFPEEKEALAAYILGIQSKYKDKFNAPEKPEDDYLKMPYTTTGYNKFLSAEGYPAIKPPWGTLNAINLNTGKIDWKVPLGAYDELKQKNIPPTGTENYGAPVVTAGGLIFIAAAKDGKLRAFNKRNGQLLWEYNLPAPGFATPSIYSLNNKQYLVIACGGGKLNTRSGDSYIAFTLFK